MLMIQTAYRWKAITLLDEADVMLADRSTHKLTQNARTAVLLQLLEYSEGIIFLTSNMNLKLDQAIKDRCSMKFIYSKLDPETKLQILDSHLDRLNPRCDPDSIEHERKQQLVRDIDSGREVSP